MVKSGVWKKAIANDGREARLRRGKGILLRADPIDLGPADGVGFPVGTAK
jgi:hypothetical protein